MLLAFISLNQPLAVLALLSGGGPELRPESDVSARGELGGELAGFGNCSLRAS